GCSTPSVSPRRFTSIATLVPAASLHIRSTGPIAVGYSLRTSRHPSPSRSSWAASNSCKCDSTPSLTSPGSSPSDHELSLTISSRCTVSVSPDLPVTTHCDGDSVNRHGGGGPLRPVFAAPPPCPTNAPA